jgi:hypothetical protein
MNSSENQGSNPLFSTVKKKKKEKKKRLSSSISYLDMFPSKALPDGDPNSLKCKFNLLSQIE